MPETMQHPTRTLGTLRTEKMLAMPGMVEFRLAMVHANGGQPLEYKRRPLSSIVGHEALSFDWRTSEFKEDDLLIKAGHVGVISMDAPVYFQESIWAALFGGITVSELCSALYRAKGDDEIETVVLDMDCPGGQVAGIGELIEAIDALAASKRVIVYVHDMMASLAFWVGSRAHLIVSNTSGECGSIGAIAMAYDDSGWFSEHGIRAVPITEAEQKTFGHMGVPISDAMVEREMAAIRDIGSQFRASVSAKTGIGEDELVEMAGAMYYGSTALAMGLVDAVMPPAAFYAAVGRGEFDSHGPGETENETPTSGEAAAQHEDSTMSTIDVDAMSEKEAKAALRKMMAEQEEDTSAEEEQDEDEMEEDEDEQAEEEEDEDSAEEEEEEEQASARRGGGKAASLSVKEARAVLADFDEISDTDKNALALSAIEHGWSETTLLRKCVKAAGSATGQQSREIEETAKGSDGVIGGGNAGATSTKGGGGANAQIDQLAAEMVAANPDMTHNAARCKVMRDNEALRDQFVAESNAVA